MSARDRHNRRRDHEFNKRRKEKDTAAGRNRRTIFRARSRTNCPVHKIPFAIYGTGKDRRVRCPFPDCDIGASNVPTSAPASVATRRKHREAHGRSICCGMANRENATTPTEPWRRIWGFPWVAVTLGSLTSKRASA